MDERIPVEHLPRAIAAGDGAAFEQLFHEYRDRLCRYLHAYVRVWEVAEDLVGELFLELWRQRERLADVRDLDAYLYTTARRDVHDYLRHRAIEHRHHARERGPGAETMRSEGPVAERKLIAEEASAAVSRALDALPDRQREILRRRFLSQSYQEIATALAIDARTVETHVRRAFARLRELLPKTLG